MGKNIEKKVKLEQAKRKYKKFLRDNDFRDVREYFTIGLEAEIFIDRNGITLTKDNDLFWGFYVDSYGNILWDQKDQHKAVYQYTFRRQPVSFKKPSDTQVEQQLKRMGIL